MKINKTRFMNNLKAIGETGKIDGAGITRLAFSNEYSISLDKLEKLMIDAGLEVKRDKVGNLYGKRLGTCEGLGCIMSGSHLDTVKNGGLYDGNLGIIAALEVINTLNDNNIQTKHSIEVVAFNAEEGSEMGGTFGSRVMTGRQNLEEKGIEEKLALYNLTIDDVKDSIRNTGEIAAFLELHIEQGGYLENNKLNIGIVDGIVGITRYLVKIKGEANHAGTTPMDLRRDALVAASKMIVKIDEIAQSYSNPFVATVGSIEAFPGSVNVIPGEVHFWIEMRDLEQDKIIQAVKRLKEYANALNGFEVEFQLNVDKPSKKTNEEINKVTEKVCMDKNIKYTVMSSGAGHDAKELVYKVPTSMIFVPSKNGISHSPNEFTDENDLEIGVEVLASTILELDKII